MLLLLVVISSADRVLDSDLQRQPGEYHMNTKSAARVSKTIILDWIKSTTGVKRDIKDV